MKFLFVCLLAVAAVSAARDKRSILGAVYPYGYGSLGGVAVGLSHPGSVAVGPSHTGSVAVGPSHSGYVAVGPSHTGSVAIGPSNDGYIAVGPSYGGVVSAPLVAPVVHSPLLGAGLYGYGYGIHG